MNTWRCVESVQQENYLKMNRHLCQSVRLLFSKECKLITRIAQMFIQLWMLNRFFSSLLCGIYQACISYYTIHIESIFILMKHTSQSSIFTFKTHRFSSYGNNCAKLALLGWICALSALKYATRSAWNANKFPHMKSEILKSWSTLLTLK